MRRMPIVCALLLSLTCADLSAQDGASDAKFDSLAKRYQKLLSRRPRKGTAFDMLYRHYLDAGRLDALVSHYVKQTKNDPKDVAGHIVLALIHERAGRLEAALSMFQQSAKLAPKDFYPEYAAAVLMVRQYRPADAVKAFERALTKEPDQSLLLEIYKRLGRLHLRQGKQKKALEVWERLAKDFPEDKRVLEELAQLLSEEEQFDAAINRFEQLIQLSKSDLYRQLMARVEIGQIQVRQGKLKTAIATFESCLEQVRPDSWMADDLRRRVEEVFLRGEDLAGLIEYYEKRLEKHPDDLSATVRLAATYSKLDRGKDAIAQYRAALKRAPTRRDIRVKLIDELTRQEDLNGAIVESEALVKSQPDDIEYIRQLGQLYLRAAGKDRAAAETKALDTWKRIADRRPKDPLAAVQVAELCRRAAGIGSHISGKSTDDSFTQASQSTLGKAALQYYEEAVARGKGAPQYHEYLGEYLYSIGRTKDALVAWRKLAAGANESVDNLKRLAQVLAGTNHLKEATTTIEQAIAKDRDSYDLHDLAADLLVRREMYTDAIKQVKHLDRLADSPELKEQALKRRVTIYMTSNTLSAEARRLSEKLEAGNGTVRDYWLAAMMASSERRSGVALKYLATALEKSPDDRTLLRYRAEVFQQGGDLAGAADQFRRLAKLEPKSRSAHLRQVVQLEAEMGRLDEARKLAEEIVRMTPGNVESIQLLAEIEFRAGEDEKGLNAYRQAVQSNPRNTEVRMALAQKLVERQQIDEAIEHLWRAFELTEDLEGRLAIVGQLAENHIITNRLPLLVDRLKRMRGEQEDPFAQTLYLVSVHVRAEDFVNARRELASLLSKRPDDVRVLAQLVALSDQLDDPEQAIRYQERVVELSSIPKHRETLADLYTQVGRDDDANLIWKEIYENTDDPKQLITAIDSAMRRSDHKQAILLAGSRWTKHPDDWRFGQRLAWSYWFDKQQDRAAEVAQALLQLLPNQSYQEPKPKAGTASNSPRSYMNQYPPLFMRISMPMQLRQMMMATGSRSSFYGFGGWQARELLDVQMMATIMLYEKARLAKNEDALINQLTKRSNEDLMSLRQLVWVHMSHMRTSTDKTDAMRPLLDEWIKASPSDAEPRLILFVGPFMRGDPEKIPNAEEHLASMKIQYEWFVKNRPALGRFLTGPYAQILMTFGKRDEALEKLRHSVAEARNMWDLQMTSYLVMQMQDLDVMSQMITRIMEFRSKATNASFGVNEMQQLLQSYAQMAARSKKWDQVVESFDRFMTASHPDRIRVNRRIVKTSTFGVRYRSSRRRPTKTKFPAASAWLDESRIEMLKAIHKMLQTAGEMQQLDDLVAKRMSETEGIPQQCWTVCHICLQWMHNDREEAIKQLAAFTKQVPGNIEARMLLAQAYAQTDENAKALAAIEGLHLPFGQVAKRLEQLRMELAMRSDNEEVGKQAALRLFGMRLSTDEQTALAKVMRRLGLATRSEELNSMAIRTASNKPSELYKLMQQHSSSDLERAAEIARMIMRQVRRGDANSSNNSYRSSALGVLKRVGELDDMIKKAEKQLAAAPKSVTLMETLVEYYTANGDNDKVQKTIDAILKIRPKDTKLHYKIAQSLFNRNKYADGIKRLEIVWKNDPELVMQNSYQIGEYYAKAKKLHVLAEHIKSLKGSALIEQNSYYITNLVDNLRHSTNDVEGVLKLYRVAADLVPKREQPDMIRNCGMMLVEKKRKAEAYQIYKEYLFPSAKDKDFEIPMASNGSYSVNGRMITLPRELAKYAVELKKTSELEKEIASAAAKHPKWKPLGELLTVLVKRTAGDEGPITEFGKRFMSDTEFAKALAGHYLSIREEFDSCKSEPALRTAIQIWTNPPKIVGHHHHDSTNDQIRLAKMHMKLKEPKQARSLLLKLTTAPKRETSPFGHDHLAEQEMRKLMSVANALRENAFLLDSVDVYQRALSNLPSLEGDNWIRRNEVPAAIKSMRDTVLVLTTDQKDKTLAELETSLTDKKHESLNRFFAILDVAIVDSRYSSSSNKRDPAKEAQQLANPNAQLLPALLMYAAKVKKLDTLSKLLAQRIEGLDEKAKKQHGQRLAALQLMMAVSATEPPKSVGELKMWAEETKKKKDLVSKPETWLLAIASLRHESSRQFGVEIAAQVATAAIASGNSGRQQVAIAAITEHAGDRAEALVQKLMAGRKGDPKTLFQFAQVHFQRKEYAKAVKVLEEVWRRDPELVMPKIRQLMDYYAKAERIDSLAESLRSVNDQNLIDQYPFEVPNSIRKLPKNLKLAKQVVTLYLVSVELAPEHSSYISSQFNQYLQELPQNSQTLDVYLQTALPSKTNPGEIAYFADKIIELTNSTRRVDSVKKRLQQSIKQFPDWAARGELLIGMLDSQAGKQDALIEVAKKYKANSKYAKSLKDAVGLLRTHLTKTNARPALELALELWRDYAANQSGDNAYGTQKVAEVLVKLGDREAARQTLLTALYTPFTVNYQTDERYIEQMKLQRLRSLASAFERNNFKRDAITAHARTSTIDLNKLRGESYYARQIGESKETGRKLIGEILKSESDQTLTDLEKILTELSGKPEKAKLAQLSSSLDTFFTVFDGTKSAGKAAGPDALMSDLLAFAKKNNRLASLQQATQKARQQNPNLTTLVALETMCRLAEGKSADAQQDLLELVKRAKSSPDDSVWLVARDAINVPATRDRGHQLAELVANHAAGKGNRSRQEAAVLALTTSLTSIGKTDQANALMKKLIGGANTPEAKLQIAHILFSQNQADQGATMLEETWKKDPAMMLTQFAQLLPLYMNSGQTDSLVAGLTSVKDKELRQRHDNHVINAAGEFARNSKKVDESTKLLRATVEFSESGSKNYAFSTLVSHLNRKKRQAEAWEVYREAILPPTGPTDRLAYFATSWISLSKRLKKMNELETQATAAAKAHPKWTSSYDLLLAMAQLSQTKKDQHFVELVKKYESDSAYAKSLDSSKTILRRELAKCDSKDVLPLSLKLWETEINRLKQSSSSNSSSNYQEYDKLAQLYLKVDRREDARKLLWDAVEAPAPRYGSSYMPYYYFQRSEFLGPKFQAAGFHLDAIQLMQRHQSLAGTKTEERYRLGTRLKQQNRLIRNSIHGVLSNQLDDAVQGLEKSLSGSPPDLDTYFAAVSQAWTLQQLDKIPQHVRGPAPRSTQLLPATLRHAKQQKRMDAIKAAVAKARKQHPKHHQLAALDIFIKQIESGSQEDIPTLIKLTRNEDRNVRLLSLFSLGQSKNPEATAAISATATDQDAKLLAITLLHQQRTVESAKALEKWFGDSDPLIRIRVFNALSRMRLPAAKKMLKIERVAFDKFDGKPKLKWDIANPDPSTVSHDEGLLTIKAKNAGIGAGGPKVANMHFIENPVPGRDFQITVCVVGFMPDQAYQQAALLCWNDEKNYIKCSFEGGLDSKARVVQFSVRNGRRSRHRSRVIEESPKKLWLRITKFGDRYLTSRSTNGKNFITLSSTAGPAKWAGGVPKFVGFAALSPGNPKPKEIDISFESFEVQQIGTSTGTARASK